MSKIDNNSKYLPAQNLITNKKTAPKSQVQTDPGTKAETALKTTDTGKFKIAEKPNFQPAISFIDENVTDLDNSLNNNIGNVIQNFDQQINAVLKSQGNNLPPYVGKDIYEKQANIKKLVSKGKFDSIKDIKNLNEEFLSLVRLLNSAGALNPEIKSGMDKMVSALLNKYGKDFSMQIRPVTLKGVIVSLEAKSNSGKPLTDTQKKTLKESAFLVGEAESVKSMKNSLTGNAIALMGIRQALLTRSMDLASLPDPQVPPELKYKDLEFIANTLKTVDQLMANSKNISPALINDLGNITGKMLGAPDGQISSALKDFELNSSSSPLQPVKDVGKQLNNVPENLNSVKKGLEEAGNQIKSATDSSQLSNETVSINDNAKLLLGMIKNAPYDLSTGVGKVIDSYSSVMNGVQSQIPVLPFPVTLPTPVTYDDGKGNALIIPAGSKVTSDSNGFTINGNGILIQSGDKVINAGKSVIQVGKNDVDKLAFETLSVNSSGSNSTLTNFEATINRGNGVSVIKADEALIDMSDGSVKLTNASLTRAQDGSIKLNSDSFFYQGNNGNTTSFNALNLEQSNADGISKISGAAKDINVKNTGNTITADSMSFNMIKDDNTSTQMGQIQATNVNYITPDGKLKADSANFNYITNPDGSQINFAATNPEWTSGKDHLKVDGNAELSLIQDKNGNLKQLAAHGDNIKYDDSKGSTLDAKNGNLNINYNPNGTVSDITANTETLNYKDKSGNIDAAGGNVNLKYDKDGKIQEISGNAKTLEYLSNNGEKINLTNASTDIKYNEKGNLSGISGSAEKLDWTGKDGDIINAAGTNIALKYNEDGKLKNAAASVGTVNYLSKTGDKIDVTNGKVNVNYGDQGVIQNVNGSAESLNWTGKDGDKVNATGLNIGLNYNEDGVLKNANVNAGTVNYTGKSGDLIKATNGNASFNYNEKGDLTGVTGSIETLDWTGAKGDTIKANGTNVALNYGENGLLQSAAATVGSINYVSNKGDRVDVVNGSASLTYDKDGKLSGAAGAAESVKWTGQNGDTATAGGLNISIDTSDPKNTKLAAAVQNLNYTKISDKNSNIVINAANVQVTADNKQIKGHVDSAQFIETMTKDLKQKYNVTVENVDLVVNKNDKGGIANADLLVGAAKAKIEDINVTVKTQNGDRVRLNVSMSKDGTYITEAFLQIPTGGEIKVEGNDYDVTLGGQQKITFTQDGKGLYTLRDDGINVKANMKDTKISVEGGSAQVSLDTKKGNIIIDEITGTNINVELKDGQKLNIDIKKIQNLIVQGGTFDDGTTKGFAIYLKPNSDNSSMSLVASADVKGIPVKVKIDNVHDFEASGYYTTNLAHVYIGDKSGKGNVEVSAGPLKSYGSAVEFIARYNPYDTQRMLTSLNTLLTNDGVYLGKGFSVEPDGVIRLGTQFTGPHAEIALMLPHNYQNPYNMTNNMVKDDAFGIVTSLGWKFKNKVGDKLTVDVNAGLVPGSYVSINQLKGSTTLYGVPLPKNNAIPTTVMGGVTFKFETGDTKVNMTSGAYVNPTAFVKQGNGIPLSENTKYGSFTGFSVTEADSTYSVLGTLGITNDNKLDPGFRLGYSQKFGWSDIIDGNQKAVDKKK